MAAAAGILDKGDEIVPAVVIGDLVAGLDVLDRADLDRVPDDVGFGIRPAGMIDVAGAVAAVGTVDGPARIDLEQIAVADVVGDLGRNLPAAVSHDELALLDRNACEQAEPGLGACDAQVAGRYQSDRHGTRMDAGNRA